MTERTIKAHRQKVMEKMQVHTLAELVSLPNESASLRRLPRAAEPIPFLTIGRSCMVLAEQIPLDSLIEPLKEAPAGRS